MCQIKNLLPCTDFFRKKKKTISLLPQVDFVRSVMAGDHLREEEHMALETLLANVPQNRAVKSNSLELTPSNTPQLSPATTPANKKNRLPIGTSVHISPEWLQFADGRKI